ncbi:MAG: hypothetical protein ACHREM_09365, partial [Polyangiales bacterium]
GTLTGALVGTPTLASDVPTDLVLADALAAEIEADLEPAIRAANGGHSVRVVVVHPTDATGNATAQRLAATLTLNGAATSGLANKGYYVDVDDGDPSAPSAPATVQRVNAAIGTASSATSPPDLVVVLGRSEGVTSIVAGVEAAWPPGSLTRPRYLLGDGLLVQELRTEAATSDLLRRRILVAARGADPLGDDVAHSFIVAYQSSIHGDSLSSTFGAEQSYDALLLALLGVAAGTSPALGAIDDSVTGSQIAAGLAQLIAPPLAGAPARVAVTLDATGTIAALTAARGGSALDVHGASGALDAAMNGAGGLVQLICIVRSTTDGSTSFEASGRVYDAATSAMTGVVRADCTH